MSTSDTYISLILNDIINDLLQEGEVPTLVRIEATINEYLSEYDLTKPVFKYDDYSVNYGEISSAAKQNETYNIIKQDLIVLFKHLLLTTDQVILNFDRWREETQLLENQLSSLEQRIDNLLLLTEDSAGYVNYIQDNFVDMSKIDLPNTTAFPNVAKNYISIGTSTKGVTKVNLSTVKESDIEFVALIKTNFSSQNQVDRSQRRYAIDATNNFWQEKIAYYKPQTVTTEFKIKLGEIAISINKIEIDFHTANYGGYIDVLPMYSLDGSTWYQLDIENYLQSVKEKAVFQFNSIELKYLKLILTKTSYDNILNNKYVYEFGIDEMSLYSEGYTEETDYELISKPLSIDKPDGNPQEFTSAVLETCENVPTNTDISYYLSASNDSTFPISGINWIPIDPITRSNPKKPTLIDFSENAIVELTGVSISYDKDNNRSPSYTINLVNAVSGTTPTTVSETSTDKKYMISTPYSAILDYQIDETAIDLVDDSIEIWRNVRDISSSLKVRDSLNGWGFSNPYYNTTVHVDNISGIEIDFGSKDIIVDGIPKNGKVSISYGSHIISVHKDNWYDFSLSGITTIALLKTSDKLYPYNHKLLVEGIDYSVFTDSPTEQYYKGFDIVAEYRMKQTSVIDMINSVKKDDYQRFAKDQDAPTTTRNHPTSVFLMKINPEYSDFTNEKFIIKFKVAETQYTYLRLKAILNTQDTSISPYIDSYRIKLGN